MKYRIWFLVGLIMWITGTYFAYRLADATSSDVRLVPFQWFCWVSNIGMIIMYISGLMCYFLNQEQKENNPL